MKRPAQQPLNGLDEAVGDPPGELVERDQGLGFGFGFRVGLGRGLARCMLAEGSTGPDVPEGDTVQREPGRPDGGEALDEERPEGGDGHLAGRPVRGGLRLEDIWGISVSVP